VSRDVETKPTTPISGGIRKDELAKGAARKGDSAYFSSGRLLSLEPTGSPGRLACTMRWFGLTRDVPLFAWIKSACAPGLIALVLHPFVLARRLNHNLSRVAIIGNRMQEPGIPRWNVT
jgi:hypothetical protein